MPHSIVDRDAQSTGDHAVHRSDICTRLPSVEKQMALGWYESCREAVAAARRIGYERVNGCEFCVPECHAP